MLTAAKTATAKSAAAAVAAARRTTAEATTRTAASATPTRASRRTARTTATTAGPTFGAAHGRCRLARKQTFTLQFLASQFARAANGFRLLARLLLARLFEVITKLHFPEDAFALHLLLQRFERLIDVVVTNENLHALLSLCAGVMNR